MSDGIKLPSTSKITRRKEKAGHQNHSVYGIRKQSLAGGRKLVLEPFCVNPASDSLEPENIDDGCIMHGCIIM